MKHALRRLGFEAALLPRLLLDTSMGFWPQMAFAVLASYVLWPHDFVPDSTPWVGYADDLTALILACMALRLLSASVRPRDTPAPGVVEAGQFRLRILQADLGNFFFAQQRRESGFLVTGKNSGSHWLKFMLNVALSSHFDVAPPARSSGGDADHIVGGARVKRRFANLPHFASSHSIPSVFFTWPITWRYLPRRPIVVLVRDIPDAMESNFAKWSQKYGGTLTGYAQGDPMRRRYVTDAWWYVHFFNRWGDMAGTNPGQVLIVRYEDLRQDAATWIGKIAAHWGIVLTPDDIARATQFTDRSKISELEDATFGQVIVPAQDTRQAIRFSTEQRAMLDAIFVQHLRHDPGYGYPTLPTGRDAYLPTA